MNAIAIKPLVLVVALVGAAGAGAAGAWVVQGWRYGKEIAELKLERANEAVQGFQIALDDLKASAEKIGKAADAAALDTKLITTELGRLGKEYTNATKRPLPVDCRPDAPRVRLLAESAAAVDNAIARPEPRR